MSEHANPQAKDESARGLKPFLLNPTASLGPDLVPDEKVAWPTFSDWITHVMAKATERWAGNEEERLSSTSPTFSPHMFSLLLGFSRSILEKLDDAAHAAPAQALTILQASLGDPNAAQSPVRQYISLLTECLIPSRVSSSFRLPLLTLVSR